MMMRTMMRMMTTTITGTRPILRRGYQSHKIHPTHSACSLTTIMTMTWRLKKAIVSSLRPSSPRIFTTLFARPHPHQRPTWLPPTLKTPKSSRSVTLSPTTYTTLRTFSTKSHLTPSPNVVSGTTRSSLSESQHQAFVRSIQMTLEEQAELDAFLEEALATG